PVVLTGEPPDPSRIPAGCRFHARCQILAGGEAERAGVADACRGQDLEILHGGGTNQVACHWARTRPQEETAAEAGTGTAVPPG
ncbi:ABC transporter ATP-binding protein, partial [Streptomyces sp. SID625]|nr:ABC transporter ATP-binding protein [Streptomyces sp. SID625]